CELHGRAVRSLSQLRARQRPQGQMRPQELEWMDADGEARRLVVGEHPLPHRRFGQVGRLDRGLERQRELLRLAAGPGDARWPRHEPQLPEKLTAKDAEAVAGT